MYQTLTFYHSIMRWLVLASLLYAIFRAYKGYTLNAQFSKTDNAIRHWTATIAHIQLVIGITLYTQSPIIKYFWQNFTEAIHNLDTTFFGLLHIILMLNCNHFNYRWFCNVKKKNNRYRKIQNNVSLVFNFTLNHYFHSYTLAIFTISKQTLF